MFNPQSPHETFVRSPVVYDFAWADNIVSPGEVGAVRFRERVGEPYRCRVTLTTDAAPRSGWLGRRAWLEIHRPGVGDRRVHGVVAKVRDGGPGPWGHRVQVDIVPGLWLLGQRVDYKIFQDRDVPTIVRDVLRSAGMYPGCESAWRLRRSYAPRAYCVQYGETDLGFISRLMDEEGIGYVFAQEGTEESLVLIDEPASAPLGTGTVLTRWEVTNGPPDGECVRSADRVEQLRPTAVTVEDHDPGSPRAVEGMRVTHPRGASTERAWRVFPGDFVEPGASAGATRALGLRRARRGYERATEGGVMLAGCGDVVGVTAGARVTVEDTDPTGGAAAWVVVSVEHTGGGGRYGNRFTAVPADAPAWPLRRREKPRVHGPQTAVVVSSTGEEIDVDAQRRVLVRFRWDLRERLAEPTCRVRVSQALAGSGWGTVFLPREGMEVVVQFLDGDPDRPLVTGCVYNGENPPPYDHPTEATKTTIRTARVPHGDAHHELTFDDAAEHPGVYLHAAGSFRETVTGDRTREVGGCETVTVGSFERSAGPVLQGLVVYGDRYEWASGAAWTLAEQMAVGTRKGFTVSAGGTMETATCELAMGVEGVPETLLTVGRSLLRLETDRVDLTVEGGAPDPRVHLRAGDCEVTLHGPRLVLSTGHGASIVLEGDRVTITGREVVVAAEATVEIQSQGELTLRGVPVLINC